MRMTAQMKAIAFMRVNASPVDVEAKLRSATAGHLGLAYERNARRAEATAAASDQCGM